MKHAGADAVTVTLAATPAAAPERVELEIRDTGRGFVATGAPTGRGLTGMRRRAERIGAALDVQGGARGTMVRLVVPLQPPGEVDPATRTANGSDPAEGTA